MLVRIFNKHEVEFLKGRIEAAAEDDQRSPKTAFGHRVIDGF
jgi:hypothetical protein